ncbi:MAG: hypothetical protein KC469_10825 [Flavobacteriaceae bacterium]|jgi:hypothetical protein|nr:hypothetical protein [Flavobacteriaceae bacterium]
MRKLLLSVAALMVATFLFSLGESSDSEKSISQDNATEIVSDNNLASK